MGHQANVKRVKRALRTELHSNDHPPETLVKLFVRVARKTYRRKLNDRRK